MSLFDKLFKRQNPAVAVPEAATQDSTSIGADNASLTDATAQQALDAMQLQTPAAASPAPLPTSEPAPEPPAAAHHDLPTIQAAADTPTPNPGGHQAEILAFPSRRQNPSSQPPTPGGQPREALEESSSPEPATPDQPSTPEQPASQVQGQTLEQMRQDPNFVRVFDPYGQEIFVPREQWANEVLPNNIQAASGNPDELYAVLVNAMNDGFFTEIGPAAAHLQTIDPDTVRGACIHAIVLVQLNQADAAERLLRAELDTHGEHAAVLTNLARIVANRGDRDTADPMLWRALELDPNLENALGWYLSLEQERGGEPARRTAMERVAALPGSWRVRLWLAKLALDANNLPAALDLYRQGLAAFPGPVPGDFLYPMSGDLGTTGHLRELISMTEPYFLPEIHGLPVGNNLIKAHFDLGELDQASAITQRLFAMKRPDWREPLGFWDQTIHRARRAAQPAPQQEGPLEIGMLEMIGPVWRRAGGPLEDAFGGPKEASAPVVTLLGGTADLPANLQGEIAMQVADALGRLSRAMPLFLAEQVEFHTTAHARTLLPRVAGGSGGFVLRGSEWTDPEAIELAREGELAPDLIVRAHVDARAQPWVATAKLTRAADASLLGEVRAEFPAGQPEYGLPALASALERLLAQHSIAPRTAPAPYQVPETAALANYLLRLEQLLALRSAATTNGDSAPLSGEREIMEGNLGLALQQPANPTVRALLASTTATMWRLRPHIAEEFEDRLELLARDRPVGEPVDSLTLAMMTDD